MTVLRMRRARCAHRRATGTCPLVPAGLLALDVSIAAALALAGTIVLAITVVVHALSGAEAAWTRA